MFLAPPLAELFRKPLEYPLHIRTLKSSPFATVSFCVCIHMRLSNMPIASKSGPLYTEVFRKLIWCSLHSAFTTLINTWWYKTPNIIHESPIKLGPLLAFTLCNLLPFCHIDVGKCWGKPLAHSGALYLQLVLFVKIKVISPQTDILAVLYLYYLASSFGYLCRHLCTANRPLSILISV